MYRKPTGATLAAPEGRVGPPYQSRLPKMKKIPQLQGKLLQQFLVGQVRRVQFHVARRGVLRGKEAPVGHRRRGAALPLITRVGARMLATSGADRCRARQAVRRVSAAGIAASTACSDATCVGWAAACDGVSQRATTAAAIGRTPSCLTVAARSVQFEAGPIHGAELLRTSRPIRSG